MERLRKIRKWGNTHAIILTKMDMQDLKFKGEDLVDISKLKKGKKDESSLQESAETRED